MVCITKNEFLYIINTILEYRRIELTFLKKFTLKKTSISKKWDICHYWCFLNHSFKFQPNVSNRCHELLMISINLSDIATLSIKGSDYRYIISLLTKNLVKNLMQNADLTERYKTFIKFIFINKNGRLLVILKLKK